MSSLNKATIIGRLGADPEQRFTASGAAVVNMRLATTEKWTDKDGAKQESTEWHRVTVFGKLAEICGQYLKKGRQAYIEGRLQTRKWEDRDGNDRYTTEIIARDVIFLGSRGAEAPSDNHELEDGKPSSAPDDDYPF